VTVAKPAAPVAVTKPAGPVEVASVAPASETPPLPLPRSARPQVKTPAVASVPAASGAPLIIDEKELAQREASLDQPRKVEPFPLSDGSREPVVTADQLEEWDSGSLADYLLRKGLLNEREVRQDDQDLVFNQRPSQPERRRLDSFFLF